MQLNIESKDDLQSTITVEVPKDEAGAVFKTKFLDVAKKARLDGFRKGKIPKSVLLSHYGQHIYTEVLQSLIQNAYTKLMAEHSEEYFIGYPKEVDLVSGTDFENNDITKITFVLDKMPLVDLSKLSSAEYELVESELTEEDVERSIEQVRAQKITFVDAEEGYQIQKHDQVVIDFKGSTEADGEFEGGTATDYNLRLEDGTMIPGFNEGIYGHKKGDEFDIDVKFPEKYHAENLAGKDAKFHIVVKDVKKAQLPEINEEFVKSFGDGITVENFREKLKTVLELENKNALRNVNRKIVLDKVCEIYKDLTLPKSLIDSRIEMERNRYYNQYVSQFGQEQAKKFLKNLPDTIFEPQAKLNAIVAAVFNSAIKADNISYSEDQVDERINEYACLYEDAKEYIENIKKSTREYNSIKDSILDQNVVNNIKARGSVTTKKISFSEVSAMGAVR